MLTQLSHFVRGIFALLVQIVAPVAIPMVETIKRFTGCRTYMVENGFVAICLIAVVLATGNVFNVWKWIEAAAVYLTFSHAGISQRMEEIQRQQLDRHGEAQVECFYKLEPIFIGKETLWFITFVHAQLWGALVGVAVFLMYYPWREEWRKRHPLST